MKLARRFFSLQSGEKETSSIKILLIVFEAKYSMAKPTAEQKRQMYRSFMNDERKPVKGITSPGRFVFEAVDPIEALWVSMASYFESNVPQLEIGHVRDHRGYAESDFRMKLEDLKLILKKMDDHPKRHHISRYHSFYFLLDGRFSAMNYQGHHEFMPDGTADDSFSFRDIRAIEPGPNDKTAPIEKTDAGFVTITRPKGFWKPRFVDIPEYWIETGGNDHSPFISEVMKFVGLRARELDIPLYRLD